jgi:hypothetical protein
MTLRLDPREYPCHAVLRFVSGRLVAPSILCESFGYWPRELQEAIDAETRAAIEADPERKRWVR